MLQKITAASIFQTRNDMFSVLLALPLHSEPVCANAAIHAERAAKASAGVRSLSVKLAHDARLGSNHADLAKLGAGDSASAVAVDVRLISELPDVGSVSAIHFERARGWTKLYDQSIDVLPHILIAQARGDLQPRRGATSQRGAQHHDSQNSHFDCVPRPPSPKRNREARASDLSPGGGLPNQQIRISASPSARRIATSADESHQLNSAAPLATILNDVFTFSVGGTFLKLHCLFAYNATQERALIVVR
jgi:hypothetical protein